jgi:hypothetical protein
MPALDVEFVDGVTDLAYGIEELQRREEHGEPTYVPRLIAAVPRQGRLGRCRDRLCQGLLAGA